MGRFSNLANVQVNGASGVYFQPGDHVVKLGFVGFKDTHKGLTWVVESEIVQSASMELGKRPSWVMVFNQEYAESFWGDIKQFIAGVYGVDPNEYQEEVTEQDKEHGAKIYKDPQDVANERFWEQAGDYLAGDQQPLKGSYIKVHVYHKERLNKSPYTKYIWGPLVEAPAASDIQSALQNTVK